MPIRSEMKARYPKDWKLRSRFVRFVRARNRCEWCGVKNHEPHPETCAIVVLTCAHIHDYWPEAASLLNLAALCQHCHNRHDAPLRAQGRASRRQREIAERQRSVALDQAGDWMEIDGGIGKEKGPADELQ